MNPTHEQDNAKLIAFLEEVLDDLRTIGAIAGEWSTHVNCESGHDVRYRYQLDIVLNQGIYVPGFKPWFLNGGEQIVVKSAQYEPENDRVELTVRPEEVDK